MHLKFLLSTYNFNFDFSLTFSGSLRAPCKAEAKMEPLMTLRERFLKRSVIHLSWWALSSWLAPERDLWGDSGTLQQLLGGSWSPRELGFRLVHSPIQAPLWEQGWLAILCPGHCFLIASQLTQRYIFTSSFSHPAQLQGNKLWVEKSKKSSGLGFPKLPPRRKDTFSRQNPGS